MLPQLTRSALANDDAERPLQRLMDALEDGWKVEIPVYRRAQWFTGNRSKEGFYFILKRGREVDLIVVPDSEPIRQFIGRRQLKVVAA